MQTKIGYDAARAAEYLQAGKLVGLPTETVYGLAGNALNADAVVAIFQVKNRPYFDPLIVHVGHTGQLVRFVKSLPSWAIELTKAFWPGPLTLLLPNNHLIPDLVNSGTGRTAFRSPAHPLFQEVLSLIDFPLAAPSANPFMYISPTSALHVYDQLQGKIPYILDGGSCTIGIESTIIGEENGNLLCYRPGGLSLEKIESQLGQTIHHYKHDIQHVSPGQHERHYSPSKQLILLDDPEEIINFNPTSFNLLWFGLLPEGWNAPYHASLSKEKSDVEAATHLFGLLRSLDAIKDGKSILAVRLPDKGLGMAINDRLRRASTKPA